MSDKYVIKNCPACRIAHSCCTEWNLLHGEWKECENITDCIMKKIIEKCSKAHGQIIGYEKGKIYDGKNLVEANLPLTTINPLAKEILDLLDIEECE